eukprot:gene35217-42657_t
MKKILTYVSMFLFFTLAKGSFKDGKLLFEKRGKITQLEYAQEAAHSYCNPTMLLQHNDETLLVVNRHKEIDVSFDDSLTREIVQLKGPGRWSAAPKLVWKAGPRLIALTIGYQADCNYLGQFIREESNNYRSQFGLDVSATYLAKKCASFFFEHTEGNRGLRPLAAHLILLDTREPGVLRLISNSGSCQTIRLKSLDSLSSDHSVFLTEASDALLSDQQGDRTEGDSLRKYSLLKDMGRKLRAWLAERSGEKKASLRDAVAAMRDGFPRDRVEVWVIDSRDGSDRQLTKLDWKRRRDGFLSISWGSNCVKGEASKTISMPPEV